MSACATVDSPDAADSLGQLLYEFDDPTRKLGAQYHRAGRVLKLQRKDDHTLCATVAGSPRYEVILTRRDSQWSCDCSCPVGGNCQHAFAVFLAWQAHLAGIARVDTSPAASSSSASRPTSPDKLTFRQQWEPIFADKLGRPLAATEGTFLGTLSSIFHNFRQSGRVYSHDLGRLGFATGEASHGYYQTAFNNWWTTPPRDPLELWQYIAHDIEHSGLAVPDFMRPLTDTAAVRAFLHGRLRREAVARWTEQFGRIAHAAPIARDERGDPATLELQLRYSPEHWCVETRAKPDAPWKSASQTTLDRLMRPNAGGLAAIEATSAVYAFLAICQDTHRQHYAVSFYSPDPGARTLLHRLLSHRLARTLIVDAAGQPLTFSPAAVGWRLAPAREPAGDYELSLQMPDGTPLMHGALHLPGEPDFYLVQNMVYRGPTPLDRGATTSAIVPAEAIERPEVLQTLRRLGTKLPPAIEERFISVPLRARFECALAFDYSHTEIFTLHLIAHSDQPPSQHTWSPQGWQATPGPKKKTAADPAGKIPAFDFAVAQQAAARLSELRVAHDPYQGRWTRRVTRTFPEEFVAWRESLPTEVEVLATGELASLLGAPVRARVDFDLIESTVHRDWFDLALALKPEDSTLSPDEIALLLKARGKLVRLPGKGWRRLSVDLDGAPTAALEAAGFDATTIAEAALSGEKHRFHTLQLAQSAVTALLPERQADALRARARTITRPTPPAVPAGLRAELRPYQIEGFHFLAFLSANQLGGVLADDMGLGKTVQTLAWLLWLAEQQPPGTPLRALVVCPKSVVGNWETETARFAPAIETVRFTPKLADAPAPAGKKPGQAEAPPRPQLVLANYTQLRLAAEFFTAQRWHAVILDEGQFIKTPASKVAQVARELPGEQRIILTGTPIENRLLDLWSLFAFSLPGLLGTQAAFKRQYAQDNPLALTRLRTRVRHFLLRRTKAQVAADLPARTEEDVLVELEGEQRKLYDAELKRARAALLQVETAREFDQARFNILASLLRLRQICCHPALIDSAHREAPSAKLEELMERVESLRDEGHQVLVFSQFVTMLELIQEKLAAAGIEHLILTGKTEDRDALVQRFQTEKKHTVFLLSLKAAGFGLNLTAASYVILYDPWWNPAVEAQAIDRTHRIGQLQPVNAYRYIARGTVEEKIRALQKEKAALAGAIIQEESLASVLDLDSLRTILG